MDKLEAILRKYVASGTDTTNKVLGAAFIVCSKDGNLMEISAGRSALPLSSPPFTPTTWTWAASMSKIITLTGLMSLVENNSLALDDDTRLLVPELAALPILKGFSTDGTPLLEPNSRTITLRHLITHGAGMGTDVADLNLLRWSESVGRTARCTDYTLEGWSVPLSFPPGQGWYYGGATEFAGVAVERATGEPLDKVMDRVLFAPLGMGATSFDRDALRDRSGEGGAPCMSRDPRTKSLSEVDTPVPAKPELLSLGSGLYMTAADHARVLQSLLKSLSGEAGLLNKETAEEMFRPQLTEQQRAVLQAVTDAYHDSMVPEFSHGRKLDHGIGGIITLEHEPGKRRKGSMGWQGMANGRWWIDPESGIGATLFVNVLPVADEVVSKLFDELERAVYSEPSGLKGGQ
ncbi:hypothetical protein OQA88_5457 [Cercophora sp. LCS_1]